MSDTKFNPTELDLNEEFLTAFQLMEHTTDPLFITGKAGTGKSTLLKYFRTKTKKNAVVVAPTGVAAINVEGQTIHSFFRLPPRLIVPESLPRLRNAEIYRKMDTLIIDEVSMVRADVMDGIDYTLRINRNIDKPFGGVQVILFGDMFQLPPIVRDDEMKQYMEEHYLSPYFFSAKVFKEINFQTVELRNVYRQSEEKFITLLNKIRTNSMTEQDLAMINSRVGAEIDCERCLTLSSTNWIADKLNERRLQEIEARIFEYHAQIDGDFEETLYPTQPTLKLKVGSQVMFLRNDPNKRWVNGTIGKVSYLSRNCIKVWIGDGEVEVAPESWDKLKYRYDDLEQKIDADVIGTFKQFPLKLAWAITIHKSQGQTFDKVMIDLGGGAFAHGQVYVALSRCRTLEGISLKRFIRPSDIIFDDAVLDFRNTFTNVI